MIDAVCVGWDMIRMGMAAKPMGRGTKTSKSQVHLTVLRLAEWRSNSNCNSNTAWLNQGMACQVIFLAFTCLGTRQAAVNILTEYFLYDPYSFGSPVFEAYFCLTQLLF